MRYTNTNATLTVIVLIFLSFLMVSKVSIKRDKSMDSSFYVTDTTCGSLHLAVNTLARLSPAILVPCLANIIRSTFIL